MSACFQLVIDNLQKRYGDRLVLDVEALKVESSFSYALVGPNGCGKSTLLKVLSGVVDQTSGFVEVEGDKDRSQLAVGYMPQKSYVFGFSVFKNVALALKASNLDKAEVEKRVKQALDAVGMDSLAQERGSVLSGGEAQRVAFARLLVQDLDVMLLDEPTASMDIAGTLLVEEALARYRERTNCLVMAATHAPSQARRIAEKTVMLSFGRVVERGNTEQVLAHPASKAGREFLSYWAM